MKMFSIVLLLTTTFARKFFTRIINTPVYDSNLLCTHHHVILLKKDPFTYKQKEYKYIYAVDFSPSEDITDPKVLFGMLIGKKIQAKVRIAYVNKLDVSSLIQNPLNTQRLSSLESIKYVDPDLYNTINNWELSFQLYKRNCQHFSRYICSYNN